jgi:hypothetical protein
MCALHFLRNGTPRMAISTQTQGATSYGTYYEVITAYNIASQSVSYATTAGSATTATTASNLAANTSPTIQVLNFTGVGTNSGNANQSYAIYQEGGSWAPPFPDLCIGYHTGIKIGAYYGYNGIRFYNNSDFVTETFSVGNGDNHVRVANNLYVASDIVYNNMKFTGDQTYGFLGRNVYADTINGRGSDSLELNYYDGGSVIIGTGANGSKPLYAGSLYDAGNRVYSAGNPQVNITGSAGYSDYVAAQTNPVGNFNVGLSRPKGASYTTTASVVTGAIKIKLPPGTPVHGMWKMTVKIYEYGQRGNGYTIELGCHLYPSTAYNRYQWMLTTDTGAVLPIRYGTDGSSGCVWIGENGTTWSYPQVHVTEFSNGFNNPGGVNWTTGTWAVSIGAIDNSVAVDGPYTTSLIAAAYATTAGSAPANGGNASTVGGYAPSGPIGANTVVIRDSNNYIYAYYINSSVSETENPTINSFYTSNGDGWLRKSSLAHVRSQLGNYGGWITSDTTKLPLAGGNMSGAIGRTSHSSGYFVGSYNNVGANSGNTNPIYTIGSSYTPNDTSLINMYGIGYSHQNFWGAGKTPSWGLYVCEGATINATIGGGAITIWAQNDIVAFSDARVKDNVEVVTNAIEKIQAIRGVTFTRKDAALEDKDKRHAGVIAQEILKVMPEIVTGTDESMYSVAYGNMAALFIEAIKEQQLQIEELKNKLDNVLSSR